MRYTSQVSADRQGIGAAAQDTELWRLDAVTLAAMIRNGRISSREAVQSNLDRLDAVNPVLNAVVVTMHEAAMAAASDADTARARGATLGPLHGIPITVKINTDQAGWPNDHGVVAFKDQIASEDAPVVAHLRAAGGIIIGRTNSPCFGMRWFTGNDLYGETRNPWDFSRTPGGSSGGAAAAVASGIGVIGQGNDIAGSVRYPAYCCGLVGLRPTLGRVPAFSVTAKAPMALAAQFMAVQGPLTRRVRDCRIAFDVIAKPHSRDPRVSLVATYPAMRRPLRVALVPDPGRRGTHPSVAAAVRSAGRALETAGYQVEECQPPEMVRVAELWGEIAGPDTLSLLEPIVKEYGDEGIRRGLAFWRGAWPHRDPAITLNALAERVRILRLWGAFFEEHPIVIMPTCTEPPFAWDEDVRDQPTTDRIVEAQRAMLAVSVLGLPGLSVPTGTVNGLPTGVQIVAAPCREDLCFDAGEIIEGHYPMPTPIDPHSTSLGIRPSRGRTHQ
jgi:amidase